MVYYLPSAEFAITGLCPFCSSLSRFECLGHFCEVKSKSIISTLMSLHVIPDQQLMVNGSHEKCICTTEHHYLRCICDPL